MRNTKIVCTLGPASYDETHLRALIDAGMNVARLNFSHITPDQYPRYHDLILLLRGLSEETGREITILLDSSCLKIRIGEIKGKRMLRQGEIVRLIAGMESDDDAIPIHYDRIVTDVAVGDRILFADGRVVLKAVEKKPGVIMAEVQNDGDIISFKGVNIPDTIISGGILTEKDERDIRFGIGEDVDLIAISFVQSASDVRDAQKFIADNGGAQKVIVKVERHEAVRNIEEITKVADGLMIARGDLGMEMPFAEIPVLQKKIIYTANLYGKPVITATQMLYTMVDEPVPTRAEISDIANAVHDQTDAVMLSDETAIGKYPVEAVQVMAATIDVMEHSMNQYNPFPREGDPRLRGDGASITAESSLAFDSAGRRLNFPARECCSTLHSAKDIETTTISYHAIKTAEDVYAAYIGVISRRGYSALQIARFRPKIPIIAFVPTLRVKRELGLVYGMKEIVVSDFTKDMSEEVIRYIREKKNLQPYDKVVLVSIGKEDDFAQRDDIQVVTYR